MYTAELIFEHFPELTPKQKEQFERLGPLYEEWNAKINVISRKDMESFYLKHVLHSNVDFFHYPFINVSNDLLDHFELLE